MNNMVFRKVKKGDSIEAIAKLLYLTDPYIYPAASPSYTGTWCEVVAACLDDCGNFYHRDNLYLAEQGGKIVSLIAAVKNGRSYRFLPDGMEAFVSASVIEGYYAPLCEECRELSGYTVVNFCTDPAYRGKGIGKAFLAHYLAEHEGERVYLDVLADNHAAIGLYESLGFQITKAYEGFGGGEQAVKCYHMINGNT